MDDEFEGICKEEFVACFMELSWIHLKMTELLPPEISNLVT
jgi:hypothetical protein